ALAIAQAVKQAVRSVGDTLRCSIGLAPNRYLAKVASDMQKPDGLTTLLAAELPHALFRLQLGDLPGIGRRTEARLRAQGIATMEQLCSLSRPQLQAAWGSVWGERLWDWLRGVNYEEPESGRKSLGRQHVLAPALRTPEGAFSVAQKLLHAAAVELRRSGLTAGGLGAAVNFLDDPRPRESGLWVSKPSWKAQCRFEACGDAFALQAHLRRLWRRCPPRRPILVYVWMFDLAAAAELKPSLFPAEADAGDRVRSDRSAATAAMDALNRRFGLQTVYPGSLQAARGAAPTRIAFKHVPKLEQF
ncbi:MAG: DNA polymerase Y family protein, partial [Terriglobales bacterium]